MEEKKARSNSGKRAQKLTYEQLEAYAAQTTEQAKKVFQENQMLKKALFLQMGKIGVIYITIIILMYLHLKTQMRV